ncbi:MAG: hypothetical protein AAF389_18815 [Gemmatimonadota bacterium]
MKPRLPTVQSALIVWVWMLAATPASAQTVQYRTFMPHADTTLWRFAVDIEALGSNRGDSLRVVWRSESGDRHHREYVVDASGAGGRWSVDAPERGTLYNGRFVGDTLHLAGTIDGESFERRWHVSDPLLFPNVGLGLSLFVRSGLEKIDFTAVREDGSSLAELDAKREGVEWIDVGGTSVEVVRVRWAARGWRGWFYERYAWFRAADGALVRTDERDRRATELYTPPPVP